MVTAQTVTSTLTQLTTDRMSGETRGSFNWLTTLSFTYAGSSLLKGGDCATHTEQFTIGNVLFDLTIDCNGKIISATLANPAGGVGGGGGNPNDSSNTGISGGGSNGGGTICYCISNGGGGATGKMEQITAGGITQWCHACNFGIPDCVGSVCSGLSGNGSFPNGNTTNNSDDNTGTSLPNNDPPPTNLDNPNEPPPSYGHNYLGENSSGSSNGSSGNTPPNHIITTNNPVKPVKVLGEDSSIQVVIVKPPPPKFVRLVMAAEYDSAIMYIIDSFGINTAHSVFKVIDSGYDCTTKGVFALDSPQTVRIPVPFFKQVIANERSFCFFVSAIAHEYKHVKQRSTSPIVPTWEEREFLAHVYQITNPKFRPMYQFEIDFIKGEIKYFYGLLSPQSLKNSYSTIYQNAIK